MSADSHQLEAMIRTLEGARRVILATHVNPDGDAVGSALALARTLMRAGREVVVYDRDPVPYQFRFLPLTELFVDEIPPDSRFDLAVLLDCSTPDRVGAGFAAFAGYDRLACIDHHVTNDLSAAVNLVDAEASATGELVYEVVSRMDPDFGLDVALNLYTAILTDTGSFHYSNSTPRSFVIAGELVRRGVDPWLVAQQVYECQPPGRIELIGETLRTLQRSASGAAAGVVITREVFRRTGTNAEHSDSLVNYPRSIAGVEVAFLLREEDDGRFKLSFRSRGAVNVAALAQEFGGGGHKNAAGCLLTGSAAGIVEMIFSRVDDLLGKRSAAGVSRS
ncbi:MAG: bifunctional oligoribonuclease/PAP phosphatase NrnA [Deltaproteobacteria bacterium]|nr:bifunctional oligoribonuclease/PAP phosphatase NrnA [Candidatus Anaeroferrophillacea bacterium]